MWEANTFGAAQYTGAMFIFGIVAFIFILWVGLLDVKNVVPAPSALAESLNRRAFRAVLWLTTSTALLSASFVFREGKVVWGAGHMVFVVFQLIMLLFVCVKYPSTFPLATAGSIHAVFTAVISLAVSYLESDDARNLLWQKSVPQFWVSFYTMVCGPVTVKEKEKGNTSMGFISFI